MMPRLEANPPREATTAADSWSIEPRDDWEDTYDNASAAGKGTNPRSDPVAPVQALPIHHLQRTLSSAKPATTSVLGKEDKERKAGEAEERVRKEGMEKARIKAEQEDAARLARLREEEQRQRQPQRKPAPALVSLKPQALRFPDMKWTDVH
jgi:hypothetical protein